MDNLLFIGFKTVIPIERPSSDKPFSFYSPVCSQNLCKAQRNLCPICYEILEDKNCI